jgi:hypothetical protein
MGSGLAVGLRALPVAMSREKRPFWVLSGQFRAPKVTAFSAMPTVIGVQGAVML